MDLWTIIKVVVRRWYVVLPILAITAVVAYEVAYKAPPTYQASGSALLVAPNVATGATGLPIKQNPYLLFSGSLNITASALVRVLDDTEVRGDLIQAGLLGDYEIGVEQSTPTIGITVNGDTSAIVIGTVRRLLDEVRARLRSLQNAADAPPDLRIGVELLVNPSTALTLRGKVARTMATIGVLGVLAAAAVALMWEAAATARRRSKALRRQAMEQRARHGDGNASAAGKGRAGRRKAKRSKVDAAQQHGKPEDVVVPEEAELSAGSAAGRTVSPEVSG